MSEQNEILPFEPSQIKQSVDRFSGELTQVLRLPRSPDQKRLGRCFGASKGDRQPPRRHG